MSEPQFVHKLAPVGVAVFGAIAVIAGIGITAAPAQAGSLQWADGASSFFDEVNPVAGDTFSVTFSPDNLTFVGTANGEFVPPFPAAPPPFVQSVDSALGNFEFVSSLPLVDDVVQEFKYELTNDLVFDFNNEVVVTYAAGSLFQGEFDVPLGGGPIEGVEFEAIELAGVTVVTPGQTYNLGEPDFPVTGSAFVFEDIPDGAAGYSGSVSVTVTEISEPPPGTLAEIPEPTTILGLFAVCGLGLGLKCKKQVS
ncbi:conserved hypothetical protein [Hyella patelloides LEGE 07179]|uniref:PEP-CTERM protein-sorting domain-containing protein n=1 Tax=Hyella patelloides LEGE 07179 TaxID=945734 RepID=A0A563VLW6_9CYAN|nr:PEP-CTERM sorting domain-containing protein [Hyella patelloides]VEP12357.1 conserved hypothetical protein [Hyella patelloides LEGE 07179]